VGNGLEVATVAGDEVLFEGGVLDSNDRRTAGDHSYVVVWVVQEVRLGTHPQNNSGRVEATVR
jgi:hypothetical protein